MFVKIILCLSVALAVFILPAAISYVLTPNKKDKKDKKISETVNNLCKFNDNGPHLEKVEENYAKANIKNEPWVKEEITSSTNQNNDDELSK